MISSAVKKRYLALWLLSLKFFISFKSKIFSYNSNNDFLTNADLSSLKVSG